MTNILKRFYFKSKEPNLMPKTAKTTSSANNVKQPHGYTSLPHLLPQSNYCQTVPDNSSYKGAYPELGLAPYNGTSDIGVTTTTTTSEQWPNWYANPISNGCDAAIPKNDLSKCDINIETCFNGYILNQNSNKPLVFPSLQELLKWLKGALSK